MKFEDIICAFHVLLMLLLPKGKQYNTNTECFGMFYEICVN